jgi:Sulfotransferase family
MLSHRLKTIFVHIPKTGGQSVEHMFLRAHGLTWATRGDLLLRPNENKALGPSRLAHLYAEEYYTLGHVDRETFDRYYRFAVVRDPYDRIVSEFNFREHDHKTVRDFYASVPTRPFADRWRHVVPQAAYLVDRDGEMLVEDIIRFETLGEDIAKVFARVPELDGTLDHINSSKKKRLRRADLDPADIAFITETFADDFRLLDYPRM